MLCKTIDRWAYRNDTHEAMCWVTAETDEDHELVYVLHTDRTPLDGKGAEVPMPWSTDDTYTSWEELEKACPPAVIGEGVYGTSLIGRGDLTEHDVWLMVRGIVEEEREAAKDPRTPFEILLGACRKEG